MDKRVSLALVAVAAMALAGCGRKGPLELPPTATPAEARADAGQQTRVLPPADSPGLVQPPTRAYERPAADKLNAAAQKPQHAINGPEEKPGKPFILDPLL